MIEENLELIAKRVPPGDNWTLVDDIDKNVIEGLVNALTAYLRKTKFKGDYRLSPLDGELYAIREVKSPEPEPEVWDLYGEY